MNPPFHTLRRAWLAAVFAAAAAVSAQAQAPSLEAGSVGGTEGHARLVWEASGEGSFEFELEVARDREFTSAERVYRGPDRASFRSGLPEGTHWFRLRERAVGDESWSAWSIPIAVAIAPHDLAAAWSVFGVGAFLVAAIVVYLVTAGGRSRTTEGDA